MTPEQGYAYAKRHTCGEYVSMGVLSAEVKLLPALTQYEINNDHRINRKWASWFYYDNGFQPSAWAVSFWKIVEFFGAVVSVAEIKWLHETASLDEARVWANGKLENAE